MLFTRANSKAILLWLIPLSFFAFQFILRLWPSLMMKNIMHQFGINATSFGVLASVYYYGYAAFQIPIALCLERIGARYVISICALICGLATYMGAKTGCWYVALLARFLVGVGSAAGFLGVSKVITERFAEKNYSRMIGLSFSIGLLGAIYGGKPISLLMEKIGEERVVCILTAIAIFIALISFVFLKSPSVVNSHIKREKLLFKDLKKVLSSKAVLLLAGANLLMVGSLEGFADVWGINYLMVAYQMPKVEAAGIVSFIFVGMLFGGPILAYFANKSDNLSIISACGLWMAFLLLLLIYQGSHLHHYELIALFTMIGILCCYQVLIFAAGSEYVDKHLLSITVAFLNCINMLGGSFFHSTIGFIMDYNWEGDMLHDHKIYSMATYKIALSMIPICAGIGGGVVGFVKMNKKLKKS
jgi:MFS family permease